MCIVLVSTAHPDYPLIVVNNRDEFLHRPTLPAAWWDTPHGHVLGGRDLQRDVHGTWLGVTRQGRIAVLTNFREGEVVVLDSDATGGGGGGKSNCGNGEVEAEEEERPSRGGLASGFLVGAWEDDDEDDDEGDGASGEDKKGKDVAGSSSSCSTIGSARGKRLMERYARRLRKSHMNPPKSSSSSRSGSDATRNLVGGFSLLFGRMQDCGGGGGSSRNNDPSHIQPDSINEREKEKEKEEEKESPGLAILSNRTPDEDSNSSTTTISTSNNTTQKNKLHHLATRSNETHALSNTHFTDRTWPKVLHGEKLLADVIAASSTSFNDNNNSRKDSKKLLITQLFEEVLSSDTLTPPSLPPRKDNDNDREGEADQEIMAGYLERLKESIFIPRIGGGGGGGGGGREKNQTEGGGENDNNNSDKNYNNSSNNHQNHQNHDYNYYYGTQKQTVILMDRNRHVTFVERTVYDERGNALTANEKKKKNGDDDDNNNSIDIDGKGREEEKVKDNNSNGNVRWFEFDIED